MVDEKGSFVLVSLNEVVMKAYDIKIVTKRPGRLRNQSWGLMR